MNRVLWCIVCATAINATGACSFSGGNGAESLTGYWVVTKAYRDKVETKLLADVYFLFSGDGAMRTNLPHTGGAFSGYTLTGDQLTQQGNSSITYDIIRRTDSTLILGFETNNTFFELHLALSEQPAVIDTEEEEPDTTLR